MGYIRRFLEGFKQNRYALSFTSVFLFRRIAIAMIVAFGDFTQAFQA
jgi:hypothetical protein